MPVIDLQTGSVEGREQTDMDDPVRSLGIIDLETGEVERKDREPAARIDGIVRRLGGTQADAEALRRGDMSGLSQEFTSRVIGEEEKKMVAILNNDLNMLQKAAVGAGRGLTTLARGVGLAEPEDPATARTFEGMVEGVSVPGVVPIPGGGFAPVKISPESIAAQTGEIVGEAAPFLFLGLPSAAIKPIMGRIAANFGIGALEGGIITRGRGGDIAQTTVGAGMGGAIASGMEAAFPVISSMARAVFRRLKREPTGPLLTPEGTPTPDFQAALDETGTTFEGIVDEAFTKVNQAGVDPEQAARAARFESQGIPATRGDITQEFDIQAQESRLAGVTGAGPADEMRAFRAEQSRAFESYTIDLVESLGLPANTGESVKAALVGRKKLLQKEKNAYYKAFADAAPELNNMPVVTDKIFESIPSNDIMEDLAITAGENVNDVRMALARFGIDQSEESAELLQKAGIEAQPLTLANYDRFRKTLNRIERKDLTGAVSVATGPIKEALDAEVDAFSRHIAASGKADDNVLEMLKEARKRVRTLKTEYSKESIAGRLINLKRDGYTPVTEASKVTNLLLKPNVPIEHLRRTLTSLGKAGKKGHVAIKEMQASVILNALEASLKAASRKAGGRATIGGYQFAKSLTDFGDDKLDLLFRGNKETLGKLRNLKQTALDREAAARAMPKGSADVNIDIAARMLTWTGISSLVSIAKMAARPAIDSATMGRTLRSNPTVLRTATALERDFPALASALSIAAITTGTQEDE